MFVEDDRQAAGALNQVREFGKKHSAAGHRDRALERLTRDFFCLPSFPGSQAAGRDVAEVEVTADANEKDEEKSVRRETEESSHDQN